MPLVRVSIQEGKSVEYRAALGDGIHRAMLDTINVPAPDRFQLFHEHSPESIIYDPTYLGIARTDDLVVIQITLNAGRSLEQKRALYARLAENLARSPGVRREDVLVSLVEVPKENWSFGNGEASYAP